MESNVVINALSQAFAEYVVACYEPKAVGNLIAGRYGYLLPHEQQAVHRFLRERLEQESFQERIAQKVQTYLESEDTEILEGIIRFRFKEYGAYLTQLVDKAVHTYETQQEYEAFLLLLRSFVEDQVPLYDMVHFIVRENDTVDLLDQEGSPIVFACHGDVLLDTLLTIAPRTILMHQTDRFQKMELLTTIEGVFQGKITVCNGCALCGRIPV